MSAKIIAHPASHRAKQISALGVASHISLWQRILLKLAAFQERRAHRFHYHAERHAFRRHMERMRACGRSSVS